ncbi:MAG: response regulator transcription factor [Candidatus Saccharimonadales bacterium]
MKLLLIDDDPAISQALAHALRGSYLIDMAATASVGLLKAETLQYDAIILDLGLPDATGLQVCQQLREAGYTGAILILTGEVKVISKIQLLDAGADDYLTKPFSLGELKARLRMLRRRVHEPNPDHDILSVGDIMLDCTNHQVERQGKLIRLRRKEFALLECLMQNAGAIVTRDILSNHAWRDSQDPWANTIDVHIKYLRDKIDTPFEQQLIKTVHGLGYKLEAPRRRSTIH